LSNIITFPEQNNIIKSAYDFQHRGADRIVKNGATYLMWDMGKGKTLTCILAMKKLGIPVLVLAPLNAATITWPDELDKWAPELSYSVLHGPNKEHLAYRAHTHDVTIINFEGLAWFYKMVQKKTFKLRKFFVIWDESSMLKDHTTKRWEIMADAMPIYSPYRVALSGTPMPNTLQDLWAQYYLLDEGKALSPSFHQFRNRFFDYTGPPRYLTTLKPGSEERVYDLIAPITDRLGPEDNDELPDVVHNDIFLELPKGMRKLYDQYEEEFMLEFPEGATVANSSAVLNSKLRQFNQGAVYLEHDVGVPRGTPKRWRLMHDIKALAIKSLVETANGRPMLVPTQFRFEKEILEKAMKRKLPYIDGRTSALDTKRYIRDWNAGKLPILLVHPRSVAFSLNLQFGGNTIVWAALPWEMDLYKQLIRRLRRRGQESDHVVVNRLIFKNTVDELVASALARKDFNQEKLFVGIKARRGGKYGCR
jgi:SNF2 family DNA or RNA helicase